MHDAFMIPAVPWENSDADADANGGRIVGDIHLQCEHAKDRLCQQARLFRPGVPRGQDDELIATETGHHIACPCTFIENGGDLFQDAIPFGMAEYVVDRLEPVEIERQQRKFVILVAMLDLLVKTGLEHGAVGKAGQNIMAGEIFDFSLRFPLFRQVTDGHHLTGAAAIFDRAYAEFEYLRLPGALAHRLHRRMARQISRLSVDSLEEIVGVLSDQRCFIPAQKAGKTGVQLHDPPIADDGEAIKRGIHETLEIDKITIHQGGSGGGRQDQERDAGNGADHDQPGDIVRIRPGYGRIRRKHRGRHGREMQRADRENRRCGRRGDALPGTDATEKKKGQQERHPGNRKTAQHRPPPVADRGGDIHSRHSDEMHDGNRQGNERADDDRAVSGLRAGGERQPETDNGENRRQSREGEIITDRNRALIGEHGDEMRGPDAEASGKGGNQHPIGLTAGRTFLRTQQKVKKSKHAKQADNSCKKNDRPVVLYGNAFQNREHAALSQPLKNRSRWHYGSALFINL